MNNNENIIDLAFFPMVPDNSFNFNNYNSDIYIKDQNKINKYLSDEFTLFLKEHGIFSFLSDIGIQLIDAYYIDGSQTQDGNGMFGIGVKLLSQELLIDYLKLKKETIENHIQLNQINNNLKNIYDYEEKSYDEVLKVAYNNQVPQCLTSILKKEFELSLNDLIEEINKNINLEEVLTEDEVVKEDIKYLKTLDFLENFKRPGLEYKGFVLGENGIKYYYFSRENKNSFMYKVNFIHFSFENEVGIEYIE